MFAAGDLLRNFGSLWQIATLSELKRLLTATVDEAFVTDQRVTALRPNVPFYLAMKPELEETNKSVNACGPDGGRTRTHLQHVFTDLRGKSLHFCGIEVLTPPAYLRAGIR